MCSLQTFTAEHFSETLPYVEMKTLIRENKMNPNDEHQFYGDEFTCKASKGVPCCICKGRPLSRAIETTMTWNL